MPEPQLAGVVLFTTARGEVIVDTWYRAQCMLTGERVSSMIDHKIALSHLNEKCRGHSHLLLQPLQHA